MKKTVKTYQAGGTTNAKKVEANKKKVAANAKKVQTNREKVALGKYSPNSSFSSNDSKGNSTHTFSNNKGNVVYKTKLVPDANAKRIPSPESSTSSIKNTTYEAFNGEKPRTTTKTVTTNRSKTKPTTWNTKLNSATSMDTTGYAAGKKTFVQNTKKAVGTAGNAYKQTSKKVARKDVPKTLAKMQKMSKGGSTKK